MAKRPPFGWTLLLTVALTTLISVPATVWASHQFTDVPISHTFHNAIDWMKDNDITVGCNPPANDRYCPEEPVTRGQMAAFMKRLAENRVVDADTVDGVNAARLAPRAAFNTTTNAVDGDFTLSTQITAPAQGVLILSGNVETFSASAFDGYFCRLELDGGIVAGSAMSVELNANAAVNRSEDCTATGAAAVDAGSYTADFEVFAVDNAVLDDASVWALWIPFDGTGTTPATFTQLGDSSAASEDPPEE